MKPTYQVAIVLAAGKGSRMKSSVRKQFLLLEGKPVLAYSLAVFQKSPLIDEIILVTEEDCIEYCKKEIRDEFQFTKISSVVAGGTERFESVYQGLKSIGQADYVFVHDGARPFLTEKMIEDGLQEVKKYKACVVGMPTKDTVKIIDSEGLVTYTPPREQVWMIQTPQIFEYELLREAYEELIKSGCWDVTDDAMVVERMTGQRVKLMKGSYENIKLTTPEDLEIAKVFCCQNKELYCI